MEMGLTVLDYHSVLQSADSQTYVPDLTLDGVHPSPAGYALMTPMVESAIVAAESKLRFRPANYIRETSKRELL